jgi:hypothetical protein
MPAAAGWALFFFRLVHLSFIRSTNSGFSLSVIVSPKASRIVNIKNGCSRAKPLHALNSDELLWKFTRRGEFEYACLIPGHYKAGMHGKLIVK